MKAYLTSLILFLLLLCPVLDASAEMTLTPSAPCLAVESVVDFTLSGGEAESYRYTMLRDGESLFSSEIPLTTVAYLPREAGDYELRVEAGEAVASAAFTVTEKLSFTLAPHPAQLEAGTPLTLRTAAAGGTGEYRYVYTVTGADGAVLTEEGGNPWHWVSGETGDFSVTVTVVDSLGSWVQAETSVAVLPGPGISLQPSGGGLRGHGGQQSWTVYTTGPWSASTDADFLSLRSAAGLSGDTLTIIADTSTTADRTGDVTITCGDRQLTVPITQYADHGVDEELYLVPAQTPIQVDGLTHALWLDAEDSHTFTVNAQGDWEAVTEDDFIQMDTEESSITLTVKPADGSTVRSGVVALSDGSSTAYIHIYQQPAPQLEAAEPALPLPELQAIKDDAFVLYSQSSGYWKEKPYGETTLEHSGCAIFALAHALQCLNIRGEDTLPEALADAYAFSLREGGTVNSTLIGHAGSDFGFKTRYELYEDLPTIRSKMAQGAVYSFAVVNGHIAMVAEMNEDGSMFRIIDSAPSATWERIKNAQLFRREPDGSFTPLTSLSELDGSRYYIENNAYGGATYWLEAAYIARRGVRLIQLPE